MAKEMKIYFVLPSAYADELSTSEEMQRAFKLCRQNQIISEWINEANCLTRNFRKEDIVVFKSFEGVIFEQLQTRRRIVGPWCLITCLLEGYEVPNNKSPIYNMAMYNLTITASNYSADEKKKMKEKIEMMGGVFILHINGSVTHLLTNSVRTHKYAVANAKGISVMLDSWVEDVWNSSLSRNVKATDAQFEKHKCPCFQNLEICTSRLDISVVNQLKKLVRQNGGIYSGKYSRATTNILLCKPDTNSEKYDLAKKAKMPIVRIEWIFDSVEKGFALPVKDYVILDSSTPTKGDAPLNTDLTVMSVTSGHENNNTNKTSTSATSNMVTTPQSHQVSEQKENQEPDLVAEIDLQVVCKAGTFLDGCGIMLAGFSPKHHDKLCRILRSAGATRYDTSSDRVTQVLVGDVASREVQVLDVDAPRVSPAWLIESIRCGQPAAEEPFLIQTGNQPIAAPLSPLSKKALKLLQNDTIIINSESEAQSEQEHESIQFYKNNKINTAEDTLAHVQAAADNIDVHKTSAPFNYKRDFEGRRKSADSPPAAISTNRISPATATNPINVSTNNGKGESPMLTLKDSRVITLGNYMEELRDTPSALPPTTSDTGTLKLLASFRSEGKLATARGDDTPPCDGFEFDSQDSPVSRYLRDLRERNLRSSAKQAGDTAAADSPIPKQWQHERSAAPPRRPTTSWSEVKRQAWSWLVLDKDENAALPVDVTVSEPVTESQREMKNQVDQLQDMFKRRESSGPSRSRITLDGQGASTFSDSAISKPIEGKDSQNDTVGWDEPMEDCVFSETFTPKFKPRKFMMSAVEATERVNCSSIIQSLGGQVSDLNVFDKTATHIVCSNPTRNEKILSSMAAGLWILHHSYIVQCAAAGRFLPEEEYALGNPKSASNLASFVEASPVTDAMNWWHDNVRQTGKRAFYGMRAIIFANNTEAVVRLIEAGGGNILQASPPFEHSLNITHCFLDTKINLDYTQFIPLTQQGVPCLNVLFLSSYLNNRTNVILNDYIVPALRNYYI